MPTVGGWIHDPWGTELVDGRIYWRNACDVKCGTTASVFTFLYSQELRDELHGRLTLSAVSDEETFAPYGTRYLSERHPEVFGNTCLNGEPSSPWTLRFGEKDPPWRESTVPHQGRTRCRYSCVAAYIRLNRTDVIGLRSECRGRARFSPEVGTATRPPARGRPR